MALAEAIFRQYFNFVYNPTYDGTVGRFSAYHKLQQRCLDKLHIRDGDRVLCVGVGTGNELNYILSAGREIEVVAVDTSEKALEMAHQKALRLRRHVHTLRMDARHLQFPPEIFDKAVCIHVMDFVGDSEQATKEILRVLKKGGEFVITYPYEKEGSNLGANIVREGLLKDIKTRRLGAALRQLAALIGVSFVYAPFLFRPRQRIYGPAEIEEIMRRSGAGSFLVDCDSVYVDLIVSGKKERSGTDDEEGSPGGFLLLQPERRGNLASVLRVS